MNLFNLSAVIVTLNKRNINDLYMKDDILNDLGDEFESALDEGRQLLGNLDLEEKIDELKTEAELLIRKHPLKSVLIGAAAGFILAKLLRGD